MKFIILITTCAMLALCSFKARAQGYYPVIAMEVHATDIANNLSNGIPDISDSTTFNIAMKILISDTASILNFQVLLKTSISEPTTLLSKTFTFDVSGSFTDGTSYVRNGYEIIINLGNFKGTISPYAELVVTNSTTTTDPIIYY